MKNKSILPRIYIVLIFLFLYAPMFVIAFFSFNETKSTSVFAGFSLRWYKELFRDELTRKTLINTLILAVSSSLIATVIGTAAAVGISKMRDNYFKKSLMMATNIPMMNPDIVTGVSMMLLFVFVGVILNIKGVLGFTTVLIAHVTFNLPYVILSVLPKIKQMDKHLSEAAQDLGCTPLQSFFKVELPAIFPGVFTGMIMSFTLSFDDFLISYFAAGPSFQTLPIRIYTMTKQRVTPDIYALSTIIFVFILLLLLLLNLPSKEERLRMKNIKQTKKKREDNIN